MEKGKHITQKLNKKKGTWLILIFVLTIMITAIVLINNKNVTIDKMNLEEYQKMGASTSIQGKVTVKYVDTEGNQLLDSTVLNGNVGEVYTTQRTSISAYKAYGNDPINKTGNFDKDDIDVIYVYQKMNDNVNINSNNNVITVQILNEKEDEIQEIGFSIVTKNKSGESITGAKYLIKDENNAVIRNATSYVEKFIIGSLQLKSEGTDSYYITESEAPVGYNAINGVARIDVTKTYDSTNKVYTVSVSSNNQEGVEVSAINNEIIVTITNDSSEIKSNFDLEIEKYITELKVINGDTTIVKTRTKEDNDVVKVDVAKNKIDTTKIEVTYGIDIKNVGEVAGYAKEITDIIPDGMTVTDTTYWEVDGKEAINTQTSDILLQPGETTTVYITMCCQLNNDNLGIKLNKAEITAYYNDLTIKDSTPDNISDEPIVITVKTGEIIQYVIETLAVLVVLAVGVVIIKKHNKR